MIGAPSDGAAARVFPGAIDDARLYNRALTDAEIAALASLTPTHTITASAGTGGTITPSGAVLVNQGANQAFAIAANAGYQIADVVVDGGSIGAVASHTFTNVTANHTISASFAAITTTALASNNNPSTFGAGVTLTATVTPLPPVGGTVTFLDNGSSIGTGTTDGGGIATLATSTLAVGSHPLTARYEGGAGYLPSTSSPALNQVVNAPTSTNTVNAGPPSGMITLGNPDSHGAGDHQPNESHADDGLQRHDLGLLAAGRGGGTGGIHEGAYLSAANSTTSFNLIDVGTDGGGNHSYEVDGTTLGAPCGSSAASGTLFTIDLSSPAERDRYGHDHERRSAKLQQRQPAVDDRHVLDHRDRPVGAGRPRDRAERRRDVADRFARGPSLDRQRPRGSDQLRPGVLDQWWRELSERDRHRARYPDVLCLDGAVHARNGDSRARDRARRQRQHGGRRQRRELHDRLSADHRDGRDDAGRLQRRLDGRDRHLGQWRHPGLHLRVGRRTDE